jgi:glycosyltransferase involved in cell wall biosynthesis
MMACERKKLTVLITCKNERNNIARCIESVRGIADELLVADSGSTDGTLEYVLSRGDCRVIERDYRTAGDFKNWAIPQAKHDWVFVVEADERVTPALAAELRSALGESPNVDGYFVTRRNHLMGRPVRYTDWGRDCVLRLVRRDLCRYIGPGDHQIAEVAGRRTAMLREPLIHYTMWSWAQYLQKLDRYTRVQAEQWHAAGRRPSWLRMLIGPPWRFFRDYVLHRGFLEGAVGLQLAWTSAFYAFLKQARLWELRYGLPQRVVEAEAIAAAGCDALWCDAAYEPPHKTGELTEPSDAGRRWQAATA